MNRQNISSLALTDRGQLDNQKTFTLSIHMQFRSFLQVRAFVCTVKSSIENKHRAYIILKNIF